MTLTEFLLARIAEDEHYARTAGGWGPWKFDPARVLAECKAKRAIVEYGARVTASNPGVTTYAWDVNTGMAEAMTQVLDKLASVYADHPDYRAEWAPTVESVTP